MEFGLVELLTRFRKFLQFYHMKTWSQVQKGGFFCSIFDYILGTDWSCLEMVIIRDVRNYSLYRFALWDRLLQRPMWCHGRYLQGRHAFPLSLPAPEEIRLSDKRFQEFKALDITLPPLNRPPRPQWMSDTYNQFIDEHAALHRNP